MIKVFIQDTPGMLGKSLYIVETGPNGRVTHVAKPIKLEFVARVESTPPEPTLNLEWSSGDDLLYALKDALTGASLGSVQGELKATKDHLNDMRALAFGKLNIPMSQS